MVRSADPRQTRNWSPREITKETDHGYDVPNWEQFDNDGRRGLEWLHDVPEIAICWYSGMGRLEKGGEVWHYVLEFS